MRTLTSDLPPPFTTSRSLVLAKTGLRTSRSPSTFARILAADDPLVAVVHNDRFSSQRNDGRSQFGGRIGPGSLPSGPVRSGSGRMAGPIRRMTLFRRGIGIVTPHRAQQAAVYDRLAAVLPPEAIDRNLVFDSIDTVERFQGQEKASHDCQLRARGRRSDRSRRAVMYSLNRFNVTRPGPGEVRRPHQPASRGLSPRDRRALEESRLLKHFVDGFLARSEQVDLPGFGPCDLKIR